MIAGPTPVNTAHGIERPPSIELVVELLVEGRAVFPSDNVLTLS